MKTVFVIDDDRLMREVLSRQLEKNNYRARDFRSPIQALPLIDAQYPDAIISDIQMPEMSGLELTRLVRERAPATPIILITGAASPEIHDDARRAGARELFEKPIKDVNLILNAISEALAGREEEETSADLDGLRLSFLTGLAHELRTPLTAIKLALESLFAAHAADHRSSEGRLLAISQRNLDRIVHLVERQLDLLQITLGDVSVVRRLVSIRDVLERVVAEAAPNVRSRVRIVPPDGDDRAFCFSDPDRLRAMVRYLVETPSCDENGLSIEYKLIEDGEKILIKFGLAAMRGDRPAAEIANDLFLRTGVILGAGADGECAGTSPHADGFEGRAFRRIIASLDGEISGGPKDHNLAVTFPVSPRFDAREDFDGPIGSLREAAMLSGKSISLIRCRLGNGTSAHPRISIEEQEFFARCRSALSEGDALVRAGSAGTYYLLLVERRPEEIDHVISFLGAPGPSGNVAEIDLETTLSAEARTRVHTPAAATAEKTVEETVEEMEA